MNLRKTRQRTTFSLSAAALLATALVGSGLPAAPPQSEGQSQLYTESFMLERCTFVNTGRNPYFILEPGHQLILQGEDDKQLLELVITVLADTQNIAAGELGTVRTRVVEEREWLDGELVEVSRNFFALCAETSDAVYFGEDVDIYENGQIVSHGGAWRAGQNGARPGILMPGTFLLGSRYFQELAPDVAMDRAENTAMHLAATVPAGTFEGSVMVVETSALSSNSRSIKIYAPGIGLIVDDAAQLVAWHAAR